MSGTDRSPLFWIVIGIFFTLVMFGIFYILPRLISHFLPGGLVIPIAPLGSRFWRFVKEEWTQNRIVTWRPHPSEDDKLFALWVFCLLYAIAGLFIFPIFGAFVPLTFLPSALGFILVWIIGRWAFWLDDNPEPASGA